MPSVGAYACTKTSSAALLGATLTRLCRLARYEKTDHKTLSCVCLDDPPRQSDNHHLTPPTKAALIRLVRVGLVGCVKNKLATTATAQDLYVSQLFRGRRWYVEQTCDSWFIMSSPHIVVEPAASVAPYDATLVGSARQTRRRWVQEVLAALDDKLGAVRGNVFEIHAGADYRDFGLADGLLQRGAVVAVPTLGLSQGRQLAFYASH